jgi:CRP/FNR family transcriptional regulator, cyclic AMP receptor protein
MAAARDAVASLRSNAIFRDLAQDVFDELSGLCGHRSAAAGEFIINQMDEGADVLFLLGGLARVCIYSPDGTRVGFRDVHAGAVFGELSAIDGKPRSASIEAVEDCELAVMPRASFLRAIAEHPDFSLAIARHLSGIVRSLTDRVFEFSTMAVRNRLRMELLRLAGEQGVKSGAAELKPAPAHADIASRISTQREAVSREFTWLAQHGFIEKRGRSLLLTDIGKLRNLIDRDWSE